MAKRISDKKHKQNIDKVFKHFMKKIDKENPTRESLQFKKDVAKYESHKKKLEKLRPKTRTIDPKVLKKYQDVLKASKAPMAKKVAKKAVKKTLAKKALGRLVPGVGAAIIAHDVLKGVSKATCSKRGGKWTSGKCVGAKKTKFKPGSKVKDPISKR